MPQRIGPNELCSCGSGKKHKHCCMDVEARPLAKRSTLVVAALFVVGGIAVVLMTVSNRSPERFPERDALVPVQGVPGSRPSGPAPPGKVWSTEHSHWHDLPAGGGTPAPPGDAPAGKVWSPEHGHWHDILTGVASN